MPSLSPRLSPRTRVVGLLGGIASGKSRAAELLAGPSGRCLSADALAHAALAAPELAADVQRLFGPGAFDRDGRPDRAAIAAQAFRTPELRRQLELLIHPRVRAGLAAELAAARAAGVPVVCLDVPLLLENDAEHGLARASDVLIFVDAPLEQRDQRAQQNRGWAPGEVQRREAHQWPLEAKRQAADLLVLNHGELAELERRLGRLRALWFDLGAPATGN